MSTRREEWEAIEHLSEAMLDAARHHQWEDVTTMEKLRHGLLDKFFAETVGPDESAALDAGIRRVLAIDREVMTLGRGEQARLSDELTHMVNGRRAAAAYIQNR